MLKDLIKIANDLDAAGIKWAADKIDGIVNSMSASKPSWIINPETGRDDSFIAAAVGHSEIENDNVEAGRSSALEQAKASLRTKIKPGQDYMFVEKESYYEPNMIEPEQVWVRVVAEKNDQGSQE